jgi:two-component system, cell cycle sensor histidine kinase and response regulator CckA
MHAPSAPKHDIIDDLAAIVWEADPKTFQFTYVSRGAEALLGYSLEEWLSRPTFWVDLLHPDDRDQAVAICHEAVDDGRDHDFEYRVVTANGSIRWLRDIVRVDCDCEGRTERLRGLMIDVSAGRALEASLADADRYRRIAVAHGLDLLLIAKLDGSILFASPAAATAFGIPEGSSHQRSVFALLHVDDQVSMRSLFSAAVDHSGATPTVQTRYRHQDGTWRLLEAIGRYVHDERGPLIVISARDVTDRIRLEEECRQAQKMEALARITGAVAHDFNNLLTIIHGNVDLALGHEAADSVRSQLIEVKEAAAIGTSIIGQLLSAGGRQGRTVVVDVNEVLHARRPILVRLLEYSASLHLDTRAAHARVRMDSGALEQVLINLVVNAKEAMRTPGRLDIRTRNMRAAVPRQGQRVHSILDFIEIEVADTGIGMTPEVRDRIFELYFTTKEGTRAAGLGLATVYAAVRDAGGTIAVDTEVGKGTTFRIRLPLMAGSRASS